jgi:hypothetical protein
MSKDVDPDPANDDPAYKICLWRETHASKLQRIHSVWVGWLDPHAWQSVPKACLALPDVVLSIGGVLHAVVHRISAQRSRFP